MTAINQDEQISTVDIENFFINNASLDAIKARLSRFNPIKVMGMQHMEIRHSAILAWLMDPQETHGLGDMFLKAFLAEALRGQDNNLQPSALDVHQADLSDAEVKREWQNIDLLVLSQSHGWIFIIENKYRSGQHTNQLIRYFEKVENTFLKENEYKYARGIFLTLNDELPDDPRYAEINYTSICEILEQKILSGQHPINNEAEIFIKHYLEIIREETNMSEEMKSLEKSAKELYRDHRRVIDFIVEHGKRTEFNMACETVFGDDLKYRQKVEIKDIEYLYFASTNKILSFLPLKWFDALKGDELTWSGCEKWWHGFPVMMWLYLATNDDGVGGALYFYAEIGPIQNYEMRKALIERIQNVAKEKELKNIYFSSGAKNESRKYTKFFKNNKFNVSDVNDLDKIRTSILKAFSSFKPEIDAVAAILPEFIEYGEKKK